MSGIVGGYGTKSGFVDGPKGAMKLLDNRRCDGAGTLNWNIQEDYDSYEIHFTVYGTSDGGKTRLKLSNNNRSAFLNEISSGMFHSGQSNTSLVHLYQTGGSNYGDNTYHMISDGVETSDFGGSQGQAGMAGWVKLINTKGDSIHASEAKVMYISSFCAYPHSANASYGTYGHSYMPIESGRINYIRYEHENGNIHGVFKLYGIKQ